MLVPDRPGYGRSSPWPDRSIRDAGEVVDTVLDDAGVQISGLIAFSGGSANALATASTHVDRLDRIDIVAGTTPPDISENTPPIQRFLTGTATKAQFVLRSLFRGQSWLTAHLDPAFVVDQYTTGDSAESVPDDVAEIVKADFLEAFARHRSGAVAELSNVGKNWRIDFKQIDIGTHFWHGEDDTNVPLEDVRSLEARLPNHSYTRFTTQTTSRHSWNVSLTSWRRINELVAQILPVTRERDTD
ncbi:alpha/beta fold hydrolase [Halorubrum sp. BOL3-1]|uniref:alpha/beta fold hydrolase n=1 Tax=Halorubrum sp. BOL3-1 TaxID=2497325 RepID=UPI0019D51F94|nr:alpha/beta hydrolase [Halorubrum sp. BOL3-1]